MFNWMGDRIGEAAAAIANSITSAFQDGLAWLVTEMSKTASRLVYWVIEFLMESTLADFNQDFVSEWAGRLFYLTLMISVLFLIFEIIRMLVKGTFTPAAATALVTRFFGSIVGTMIFIPLVAIVTWIGDEITTGINTIAAVEMAEGMEVISMVIIGASSVSAGVGAISGMLVLVLVFAILLVVAALILGAVLMVRTMMLYLVAIISPIMIMGWVYGPTRKWASRLISLTAALIFTKVGIALVMAVGWTILAAASSGGVSAVVADPGGAISHLFMGILTIGVAAFVPKFAMSLFDFLGDEARAAGFGAAAGVMFTKGSAAVQSLVTKGSALAAAPASGGTSTMAAAAQSRGATAAASGQATGGTAGAGAAPLVAPGAATAQAQTKAQELLPTVVTTQRNGEPSGNGTSPTYSPSWRLSQPDAPSGGHPDASPPPAPQWQGSSSPAPQPTYSPPWRHHDA